MNSDKNREGEWQDIEKNRKEINSIDKQIISLLSRRQEVAASIGQIKRRLGIEVIDLAREEEILRRLTSNSPGTLTKEAVGYIFKEIISASRSVQAPLVVAFLGPEATFSHQAAISLFGQSTSFKAAETIEEVFSLVEKGVCQQGIVPIENSCEGSVNITLDLLYNYELKIGAEFLLRIRHHLLSKADNINKIKQLYSHPMPVAQCRKWIKSHLPGVPIREVASTSLAARMVVDEPEAAALGSSLSANTYGLNMLEKNIEDHPDNVTRFLTIGKIDTQPTGNDKTSILFFLKHRPGALFKILEALAQRGINMSRIESRPMKIRNWEYLFFVDLEGHEKDINIHEAIKEMEGSCAFMKRLGSYPAASVP